jgi:hypothetical protein
MSDGLSRKLRDGLTARPTAALLLSQVLFLFEQRRKGQEAIAGAPSRTRDKLFKKDAPSRGPRQGRNLTKEQHSAALAGEEPEIGDAVLDGTIYAGISPDTGDAMYTTRRGAGPPLTWKRALAFAAGLDAHGHQDWRVPTKNELNHLFRNRAAIGGFNETRSGAGVWYWSSSPDVDDTVWGQHFGDGFQIDYGKLVDSSLRCVRG